MNLDRQNDYSPLGLILTNDWILLATRLLLGGVFLFASLGKISAPQAFAASIGGFKLLHDTILLEVSLLILWHEVICGVLILIGVWARPAAMVLACMLIMFFLALASAYARGLDIDCGCFGALMASGVGLWAIFRTMLLFILSVIILLYGSGSYSLDRLFSRRKPL